MNGKFDVGDEEENIDASGVDARLLFSYRTRLARSRRSPVSEDAVLRFARLAMQLSPEQVAADDATTTVLTFEGTAVTFRPMEVPIGQCHEMQRMCFWKLAKFWKGDDDEARSISTLHIDLTGATFATVHALMHGVTMEDIVRGVRIWETLPCKIGNIRVLMPQKSAALRTFIKSACSMCLSAKVRQKTSLVA